ncbi:MAG: alpha/beta hydrolase domain-containing protein [Dehalococcoidia bacterium]|nr:alpha/beta hydrolase domain-containing protein [Dehalococcoidia bacterium]
MAIRGTERNPAHVALNTPTAKQGIKTIVFDPGRSESVTFDGLSFGSVGQYEKIRGIAYGEVDPSDPRNAVITDIELAPVNAQGMVEYSMDIFILKPVDLNRGNHRILFDFNNRGQMRVGLFNDAVTTNNPTSAKDAGTGFIMNLGYTVVGSGWEPGVSGVDAMKIIVPVATKDGATITGPSYEYIVFDNDKTATSRLAYAAANTDKSQAALTVRERLDDPPTTVPATGWDYTSEDGTEICLLPSGTPFQQSHIYEFTYTAKNPVIAGIGLAATRDFVSSLRSATAAEGNPLAGDVQHTFSYSISQPSRTLNDLQELGFNEDLNGQRVFDGILSHTGGGSGDQINFRFAQTGRTERNRQNHLYPESVFPFAHQVLTDHISGKTAGRGERGEASGTTPKRFEINTANEYWVKTCSLLHTDTQANDLLDPENVRFYLLSGLSHGVGDITNKGEGQQFTNAVSPHAAHRALLAALDEWVSEGTTPPESQIPRRSVDAALAVPQLGSLNGIVPQDELGWPDIPGVTYNGLTTTRYHLDFGEDIDSGIASNYPPSVAGRPAYPIFVSKVDEDGNEVAGVRLPEVEAPVATTTGWALRRAGFSENEGCESNGQHIPFAVTRAERAASGDPRLSLEERYESHDGYVQAVTKAARKLEKQRFLLPADVQQYIKDAQASDVLNP